MADTRNLCVGCFRSLGPDGACSSCCYDETVERSPLFLPHRTILRGQFVVGRGLGNPGGFGITYLAWDLGSMARVAIKEYLPREIAGRSTDRTTVQPHSELDTEDFRYGLGQFLDEARILSQFNHPNIVRVRESFEENNTACLVMEYVEGISLWESLKRNFGKVAEKKALELMMPILDGLREVHAKGFLHRDIKPHNIYVASDGRPILLDFGAARFAAGERSRSLSVVVTPGFAPFEQHRRRGHQGPWTDIYGAAATLYLLVTGVVPPDSTEREEYDELRPLRLYSPEVSLTFSTAVLAALSRDASERPQSVHEFQDLLNGKGPRPRVRISSVDVVEPQRHASAPPPRSSTPSMRPSPQAARSRSRIPLVIAVLIGCLIVGIFFWHRSSRRLRVTERSSDGRFELQSDGIIYDTRTGLQWYPGRDVDVDKIEATEWLEEVSAGRPSPWRMPTTGEVRGILTEDARTTAKLDPIFGNLINLDCECLRVWARAADSASVGETALSPPGFADTDCSRLTHVRVFGVLSRDLTRESSVGERFRVTNGSVICDTLTDLDWYTAPDMDFTYDDAVAWVTNLGGTEGGWRMPTREELKGLYWSDRPTKYNFRETFGERIDLQGEHSSCDPRILAVWAEARNSLQAFCVSLRGGSERWDDSSHQWCKRVFAVRPHAPPA